MVVWLKFSCKPIISCQFAHHEEVFFIPDWLHRGWSVVMQKEPRSRRVVDNDDEQILGISGDLIGLQLPRDMNAAQFRPLLRHAGEAVPAAEIARLNALLGGKDTRNTDAEDHKHTGGGDGRTIGEGCPGGMHPKL